jgi:predicted permease
MDGLFQDLRLALRALRREWLASLLAVLSVALGIGANTAIFSLLNALLLRPISGIQAPDRLVRIEAGLPTSILDPLSKEPVFTGACGVSTPLLTTEFHRAIQPVGMLALSGQCPQLLGLGAQLGRMLTPADDQPGSPRVAVLTDAFWRTAFDARSDALGSVMRIDGLPYTIVGVAKPDFHGLLLGFWPGAIVPGSAFHYSLVHVFARLASGTTVAQAQARLNVSGKHLLEQAVPPHYSGARLQEFVSQKLTLASAANGLDYMLRDRYSGPLAVAMGICLLVLLISCVNLANLLLARGIRRRKDMVVKLAIGAPRSLVARQLAIESLTLVLLGALAGLVLAYAADRMLLSQMDAVLINFSLRAPLDARVLAFAVAAILLTGIGFGVLPAWRSSNVNLLDALQSAARGVRLRSASGRVLVATQIALALALVAATSLFVSSLQRLRSVNLGFRVTGIVEAQLFPLPNGYLNLNAAPYYKRLMQDVESLPGVESAGYSNFAPLGTGYARPVALTTSPSGQGIVSDAYWISDRFFHTMGIPLLAGHDFERTGAAPATAIVSQSLAARLAPAGDVIGRHIRFGTDPEDQDLEIIGVAADARLTNTRVASPPMVYINLWQYSHSAQYGVLVVRVRDLTPRFVETLRQTVRSEGHEYVEYARTLKQQRDNSLLAERLLAWLSSAFGLLALVLAATGLFGLMAYEVAGRTGEIGIRIALGATRANIRWLILSEALALATAGCAAGLLLSLAAARSIQALLYGVQPFAPAPFLLAAATLLATAVLAAWLPARRACRIEPVEALRHE